jgi:hypothetical protein
LLSLTLEFFTICQNPPFLQPKCFLRLHAIDTVVFVRSCLAKQIWQYRNSSPTSTASTFRLFLLKCERKIEDEEVSLCSSEDGGGAEELTSLPSEPRSVSLTLPKQWVLLTASMRERKMEGEVAGHCSSEDGGGVEERRTYLASF